MKDFIGSCLLGALLGAMFAYGVPAKAQTYPMTDSRGNNVGSFQINGNTAQFVNPMGYTTQTATIYPNKIIISTPNGTINNVIGNAPYIIPPSPPTAPSVRVMQ